MSHKKFNFKKIIEKPLTIFATGMIVVSSLLGSLAVGTNKVNAASITTAPNATTIKPGMMADAKYNFIAQWNGAGKSTAKIFGTSKMSISAYDGALAYMDKWGSKENAEELKRFPNGMVLSTGIKGKAGWTVSNVGYVGTQKVDLRETVMDYKLATDMGKVKPILAVSDKGIGFQASGILDVKMKLEVVKSGTKTPVKTSGFYTFNDIDNGQWISLASSTVANIAKIYVPTSKEPNGKTGNWLSYTKGSDGSEKFSSKGLALGAKNSASTLSLNSDKFAEFTVLYNSQSATEFTYGQARPTADGKSTDTRAQSSLLWYFGYSAAKPLPSAPTAPKKLVSDSDQKNVTDNTLKSSVEPYTYTVRQYINKEISENYYKNADFTDNVDSRVKVTGVKVVLSGTSTDVTSKYFSDKTSGNNVKLSATAAALKESSFYGKNYDVQISVKPNGGNTTTLEIPNTGTWNINGKPVTSNKVITHIPPKIDTEVKKSVSTDDKNWSTSATINDPNKDYYYKSEVTVGDHNGSNEVTSVAVRENFENLQNYSNLKVIDNTGKDITADGSIVKSNNGKTVQITWTAKNPSTLIGKKVTMTMNANLGSATTSQLGDYLTGDKIQIPNTTDAVINGSATPSNKTEVTPKIIKDFQAKYIAD